MFHFPTVPRNSPRYNSDYVVETLLESFKMPLQSTLYRLQDTPLLPHCLCMIISFICTVNPNQSGIPADFKGVACWHWYCKKRQERVTLRAQLGYFVL